MNHQATLNSWLAAYGGMEGIHGLALDAAGVCAIDYAAGEQRHVFAIECPADSDRVFLTGQVAACYGSHRERLLSRALRLNLDASATKGAAFALDGDHLLLVFSQAVEQIDAVAFGNLVNNFVSLLDRHRAAFADHDEPITTPEPITAEAFAMPAPFMQFA